MQLTTLLKPLLTTVLSCTLILNSFADVRLPALVGSNMVLQRNKPLNIWGWADKGEKVIVNFRNTTISVITAENGKWKVNLPAQTAGGPYTMTISGHNKIKLDNILIGDVWVASGQSNMEMPVKGWGKVLNYEQEIAAANYPQIRFFQLQHKTSTAPKDDAVAWEGGWQECSPQSVPEFSSVGYFFAREIYGHHHIPIGVIHTSWGGTVAEAWISGESLKRMPAFVDTVKALEALAVPQSPADPNKATLLYNAMIHPLLPYDICGAIWYQGEANVGRAYQYRELFPLLIRDWRKQWKNGEFPFFYVQLASFTEKKQEPVESDWAELREAQMMTLSVPNTGMASAIDIGDDKDIHPKNKQEVGRRLALIARAKVYGEKIPYSGPIYQSKTIIGNKVFISFKHTDDGLVARGGNKLKGFEIAGADKKFHRAEASIVGDRVVVSSPEVARPVAVRYSWANNPDGNLYNGAGLPASPFRTDDFHGVTYGKQ